MKGKAPNKAEKAWMGAICDFGCIVCKNEHGLWSPAMPHHIDGKTKKGAHFKTIPLCHAHHQSGRCDSTMIARHPYKAQFEKAYGTEEELLAQMKEYINDGI